MHVLKQFTLVRTSSKLTISPYTLDEHRTWTVVARGTENYPLQPGYVGHPNGDFFIGADNLHFLTALTHHAEMMAIKVSIEFTNGRAEQYYYPDVKIMADSTRYEDTFYVNWKPHDKVASWKRIKCHGNYSCKKHGNYLNDK